MKQKRSEATNRSGCRSKHLEQGSNNRKRLLLLALMSTAAAVGLGPEAAFAQQTSTASDLRPQDAQVEEVVVTARRREENIQNVPIAISVVSQEALARNNIQTLGDLQALVPSLTATTTMARDSINVSIRGIGSNSVSSLPGVVAYLDEVPVLVDVDGNLAGGPGLLFDLQNVQVVKGPQGTLFGRNAMGGAVLMQTARPTNAYNGALQVGVGNRNNREIDGFINVPIVDDKLLARITINGQWRDGFTRILARPGKPGGIDADARDQQSARITLTYRPTVAVENTLILSYQKFDSHGSPLLLSYVNPSSFAAQLFPGFTARLDAQRALGRRVGLAVDTPIGSRGNLLSAVDIFQLKLSDNLTFRNIIGVQKAKIGRAYDNDGTDLPILEGPTELSREIKRQYTEEAQIQGRSFNGDLDWIVGGFYLYQPPTGAFIKRPNTFFGTPGGNSFRRKERSAAVFAQGSYDLSDLVSGLTLAAGLRYTWDSFRSENCGLPLAVCTIGSVDQSENSSAPTWTVSLDYKISSNSMLYIASRRGYRAGGANMPDSLGQTQPPFGPEYVTDYEVGVKTDWRLAGVPMRANFDIYYQDYKDIQVQQIYFDAATNTFGAAIANAAAARIYGAELEWSGRVSSNLELSATLAYLDFAYTKFGPGVDGPTLDATRTAGRPRWKYGLSANYHTPLRSGGELSLRADWSWQSSTAMGVVASSSDLAFGGRLPAFGLLNVSVNWNHIADSRVDLSLFASNLLDNADPIGGQAIYNALGFSTARYGEPRMYGARIRYNFGD